MNTRPLVIYHSNCCDGFSAAWCFWRKYGAEADYVSGVYSKPPPDCTDRAVYLVDFSYKRAVVEEILKIAASVTLLDHHKSAIDDLVPLIEHGLQMRCTVEKSGAMIAWEYLFPNQTPPKLLDHVQDRDLWRFKLPGTREIQANLFSYEYTFENWDRMMSTGPLEQANMLVAGAAIERKHHKDIAELLGVCKRRMVIGGHDVPVASLPYTLVSDAAGQMAKGEKFAACYWDTSDGRVFGLRSNEGGLDVSEIAVAYGGGGHVHSSGFTVPRDHALAQS